jgi:two-component system alkaline phosphatase synthesis response regulator PhoP/two-component system response regulator VicR
MVRILIVEDEPDLVLGLEEDLHRQGYETGVARNGEEGLAMGLQAQWDLILLDVMLPKLDGFDVCRHLRRAGLKTPIIMVTARAQEAEKEIGLDSGADDYVTKPFSLRELRARIRAHLRRNAPQVDSVWRFGEFEVDFPKAELRCNGRKVDVTAQELRLLDAFRRNRGRVLTRDQLIEAAWGRGVAITERAVDTHVFNLRKKIEPVPSEPRFLVGVRGIGYRFQDEP